MSKRMKYNLTCVRSGLQIGVLEYDTVAGYMPYLSHWDNMCCLHPIFSMDTSRCLAFARSEWNRLAKQAEDMETTPGEDNILRVGFLAVLHSLGSVQQEVPSLPPLHIVQNNMNPLFKIAYWHYYLDSQRFKFPRFKITRLNHNTAFENVKDYIDVCFQIKEDYERGVNDLVEKEKIEQAEKALKALRNSWVTPASNRALWKWIRAHLPAKYEADAQGWMSTIFLGSERTILDFDKDEIELMSEIIISECPPGTAILFAVRERLSKIMAVYTDNKEAFSVDFEEYETEPTPLVQPKPADFPTKVAYIKANAIFYLQSRAREQHAAKLSKAGEF